MWLIKPSTFYDTTGKKKNCQMLAWLKKSKHFKKTWYVSPESTYGFFSQRDDKVQETNNYVTVQVFFKMLYNWCAGISKDEHINPVMILKSFKSELHNPSSCTTKKKIRLAPPQKMFCYALGAGFGTWAVHQSTADELPQHWMYSPLPELLELENMSSWQD